MKRQGTREQGNEGTREREGQAAERMERLLRTSMPPIAEDAGKAHDLWPAMLRRVHAEARPVQLRVPWFDWALLGGLAALLAMFPAWIPVLLYYL